MRIQPEAIQKFNEASLEIHRRRFAAMQDEIPHADDLVKKLRAFQVAIPSWALGAGGTRFGRFPGWGEPANLEQKIEDIGLIHALNRAAGAISLHIPWDIPTDPAGIKKQAAELNIQFDAVNSNTFQDQPGQLHSYKFGSMQHVNSDVRRQAVRHNLEVIQYGNELGSKSIKIGRAHV